MQLKHDFFSVSSLCKHLEEFENLVIVTTVLIRCVSIYRIQRGATEGVCRPPVYTCCFVLTMV